MDIKSKSTDQFYLTCVLCDAVKDLEDYIKSEVDLKDKLLYTPRFQYLVAIRERLTNVILSNKNE